MYVSFDEFSDITGNKQITEDEYAKLYKKAVLQVDDLTNDFYKRFDLERESESDIPGIKARARAFKQAFSLTIDFMYETGITSRTELAQSAQGSVSIGRTRVEAPNIKGALTNGYVVPAEASRLLGRYGLLYRGL